MMTNTALMTAAAEGLLAAVPVLTHASVLCVVRGGLAQGWACVRENWLCLLLTLTLYRGRVHRVNGAWRNSPEVLHATASCDSRTSQTKLSHDVMFYPFSRTRQQEHHPHLAYPAAGYPLLFTPAAEAPAPPAPPPPPAPAFAPPHPLYALVDGHLIPLSGGGSSSSGSLGGAAQRVPFTTPRVPHPPSSTHSSQGFADSIPNGFAWAPAVAPAVADYSGPGRLWEQEEDSSSSEGSVLALDDGLPPWQQLVQEQEQRERRQEEQRLAQQLARIAQQQQQLQQQQREEQQRARQQRQQQQQQQQQQQVKQQQAKQQAPRRIPVRAVQEPWQQQQQQQQQQQVKQQRVPAPKVQVGPDGDLHLDLQPASPPRREPSMELALSPTPSALLQALSDLLKGVPEQQGQQQQQQQQPQQAQPARTAALPMTRSQVGEVKSKRFSLQVVEPLWQQVLLWATAILPLPRYAASALPCPVTAIPSVHTFCSLVDQSFPFQPQAARVLQKMWRGLHLRRQRPALRALARISASVRGTQEKLDAYLGASKDGGWLGLHCSAVDCWDG